MSQEVTIHSFKLGEKGLAQIFGELEAKLMEAVWALDEASVQDVIDYLGGSLNYKTTMTVLNRLADKGILSRRKEGRSFVYQAIVPQDELLARVFDQMVRGMFAGDFRHIALTQMIETAESIDPHLLERMVQLIQQRKSNESKI